MKSLKFEIREGQLFVFQLMYLDEGIEIPYVVASVALDKKIDKRSIRANNQGKNLNIVLPFSRINPEV